MDYDVYILTLQNFYREYNCDHDSRALWYIDPLAYTSCTWLFKTSKDLFWMIHGVVWLINGGKIATTYEMLMTN